MIRGEDKAFKLLNFGTFVVLLSYLVQVYGDELDEDACDTGWQVYGVYFSGCGMASRRGFFSVGWRAQACQALNTQREFYIVNSTKDYFL